MGYRGWIYSFEPLPEAYRCLSGTAAGDSKWSTFDFALGSTDGTQSLNIAGNTGAASSSMLPMHRRHLEAAPDSHYIGAIEVPTRRLDAVWCDIVPDGSTPMIKLDVQGFEERILDGATESVGSAVGLQLELSLVPLYEGGATWRTLVERVESFGMQLVHLEPGFADPRTGQLLQFDGLFMRCE
jgi:FkbM family methyltransferase